MPAPARAEATLRGDVPRGLEAGKVSEYRTSKEFHPEAVLHQFGLTELGRNG